MPSLALTALLLALAPQGTEPGPAPVAREWLALGEVDAIRGRRPFRADAVFARHLLVPGSAPPSAGDVVVGELGRERGWEALEVDEQGAFARSCSWAYGALTCSAEQAGVWLADLQGAQVLFVNGDGFVGDYYAAYGWRGVPVELREGENELYVGFVRGRPRLSFRRPPAPLFVAEWDCNRPHLVAGGPNEVELAPIVMNASLEGFEQVRVEVQLPESGEELTPVATAPLPALAIAKPAVAFRAPEVEDRLEVVLDPRAPGRDSDPLGRLSLSLRSKAFGEHRTLTYRSEVDGSVQDYSVRPATERGTTPGLVLSLHGAGVEAPSQAGAYATYPDLWIVAPTNRRTFGFDWQDWGRRDAYDVLERALALSGADPERVHLTGHSMGGHGTWHLAANDPDRWASVAPSAGWESFDGYGGRPSGELADVWQDADGASRTLASIRNLAPLPIFVLHGDADDNVPASQARTMLAALEAAGAAPASHFQPGAGHWWNSDDAPGVSCLTWPGFFELFRSSRRPRDPHTLDFVTVAPSVDAQHHWVRIEQQITYGRPSSVIAQYEPARERVKVESENVRRLGLDLPEAWKVRAVVVDGFHFAPERLELVRDDGAWVRAREEPSPQKTPARSGPFRRAFDRRFVLVYGTQGSELETATLLARARFDAELWVYRANGTTTVLSDAQLLDPERAEAYRGRNVILYGNADTNAAWEGLVPEDCPVRVRRGSVELRALDGARRFEGDDLACLFVFPSRSDPDGLIGAFGDTGVPGARLGYTFQTFLSGAGFPDLALVDASVLERGDGGVLAAGFFDARWRLPGLRFVREP